MPCKISCAIAAIFIIGMIYNTNATQQSQVIQAYKAQLNPRLKSLYEKITAERLRIYYFGYILGFILSAILILYNYSQKQKMTTISVVCTVIAISFITNYFYYILSPKSAWMLDNITNQQESQAWLFVYRKMQIYYHVGLVLGIIGVAFVALAFR